MHLHHSRFWFNLMGIFNLYTQTEDWLFKHAWNSKPKQMQPESEKYSHRSREKYGIHDHKAQEFLLPLSLSLHDFSKISPEWFSNFTESSVSIYSGFLFHKSTKPLLPCLANTNQDLRVLSYLKLKARKRKIGYRKFCANVTFYSVTSCRN